MIRNLFFSSLLALAIVSCRSESKPVSPEEAKAFARKIESSIERREPEFFDEALDKQSFLKKAGMGNSRDAKAFGSGVQQGMKMGSTIVSSVSKKGTYKLLRIYEKDNVQHALFRLYDDGSLNYHDIELKRSGKDVKIADIFVYTSGELLSETIRGLYDEMMLTKGEISASSLSSWASKLPEMRRLMTSGQAEEALDIYNELPAKVKNMRAMQIMHVLISSGLDDMDQYNAAIEQYKKLYPNEPNMQLLLLDGYIIKKQYDQALDGINEIDKMVQKDPMLDYYRYMVYNLKEDKAKGRTHLIAAMKQMPDFEDGMLELIALYIGEKDTKTANEYIEKFRATSAYDQEILTNYLNMVGYSEE